MAIKHVKDDFFSPEHGDMHRAFGFSGSMPVPDKQMYVPERGGSPPYAGSEPTVGPKHVAEPMEAGGGDYAHGGAVHHHPHGHHIVRSEHHASGGMIHHHEHGGYSIEHPDGHMTHHHHDGSPVHHMAHGGAEHHMHPHGHHVTRVEHHGDGRIVHHHAHGGHSVHHPDGRITHHMSDGSPAHMAHGGHHQVHDSSEYAHRHLAEGGHMDRADLAQDKKMVKKAVRQHEDHEHGGEHTDLELARGGMVGRHARLPRGMRPPGMHVHSPIETPPRNPGISTTPRNRMSGGAMPYGVEPSAEPDMAGSEQDIPQLARGGRARHRG